ncbi:MAG: urease accessory protein UreD [Alphaproteobacteria bacterium]
MFDADSVSDDQLQRSHGAARLAFANRDNRNSIVERYASAPVRILTPSVQGGIPEAVLANTSGGIAGGDTSHVDILVAQNAQALVTGQAAEKIYRSIDMPASIRTVIKIEDGSTLEYLPQESILFDGAKLNRAVNISLGARSCLLLSEMFVLGRWAMNEDFTRGIFLDRWSIDVAGQPIWREGLRVEGGLSSLRSSLGFANARALATIFYAGANAAEVLGLARDVIGPMGGATIVRGMLVVRMLGNEAGLLKQQLGEIISIIRAAALGRPAEVPRVWRC